MIDEYSLAILKRLFYNKWIGGKHTSKENAIGFLSKKNGTRATKSFTELLKLNYVISKPTSYGQQVSINPRFISDVKKIINPEDQINISQLNNLEDSINPKYEKKPFHKTRGEKTVKGINIIYSYHKNKSDLNDIIAILTAKNEYRNSIILGSLYNSNSLISKALSKIDELYAKKRFKKSDLYELGKEIVGNKQPIKAIIDILIFHGYICKNEGNYYQRTNKKNPIKKIEDFGNM